MEKKIFKQFSDNSIIADAMLPKLARVTLGNLFFNQMSQFVFLPCLFLAGVDQDRGEAALLPPARAGAGRLHPGQRRVPHAGRERHLPRLHHRKCN